jgi:hypothetical protein
MGDVIKGLEGGKGRACGLEAVLQPAPGQYVVCLFGRLNIRHAVAYVYYRSPSFPEVSHTCPLEPVFQRCSPRVYVPDLNPSVFVDPPGCVALNIRQAQFIQNRLNVQVKPTAYYNKGDIFGAAKGNKFDKSISHYYVL